MQRHIVVQVEINTLFEELIINNNNICSNSKESIQIHGFLLRINVSHQGIIRHFDHTFQHSFKMKT